MFRFIRQAVLASGMVVMVTGLAAAAPMAPPARISPIGGASWSQGTFTPNRLVPQTGGFVVPNGRLPNLTPRINDMPGRDPRTWSPTNMPGSDPRTWSPYPLYPRPYPYYDYGPPIPYWLQNPYWRNQYTPYPYPYPIPYDPNPYPDYFGAQIGK